MWPGSRVVVLGKSERIQQVFFQWWFTELPDSNNEKSNPPGFSCHCLTLVCHREKRNHSRRCVSQHSHPQAMVGKANGYFDKAMGSNVKIDWKGFNAGPAAIEALFAGAIDMTYIGPNPAISGYVRSNGEALRVIAGATSGGAAMVVRNDSGIQKPEDFHGKKIATPQLGNTQDVALRSWLKAHGMKSVDKGGDVQVIPLANPDQLTLFTKKELDG